MNTNVFKHIGKKIAETALHAAVFAYVSNKVSSFMKKEEDKRVRVEEDNKPVVNNNQ